MSVNEIEGLRAIEIEYRGARIKVYRQGRNWHYSIRYGKGNAELHYAGWPNPGELIDEAKVLIDRIKEASIDAAIDAAMKAGE